MVQGDVSIGLGANMETKALKASKAFPASKFA